MRRFFVYLCLMLLFTISGSALAGVDDFEDAEPNYTPVSSRVIDDITVSISNARGLPFFLVTYFDDGSHCFLGAEDVVNAPTDPTLVSGERFISTADDINLDMPIVFEFSIPVGLFGLKTVDVLEDVETSADAEVRLQGFYDDDLVVEQVITGIQGGSGVVLDWEIASDTGITRAVLVRSAGTISAGYGIDDLLLVSQTVATEITSFGQVKALYR